MLTQQERDFLREKIAPRYLLKRRVALIFALFLFSMAMYKQLEYMALAAIIGMLIKQIFETWNGNPIFTILNKLVDQDNKA
jgi:hypothetical protein